MSLNVTQKIIKAHLVSGDMSTPGAEIALRIDQTLTQDATGTMAYLQFEAIGLPRVRTDLSVSYVDHNTLQMGFRNPDDHAYLRTVAAKFGITFSPPGTGICHQLHLENFAKPGVTLIGSDSHTPTAGGVGAMAMGAGGLSVALAMAGEPYVIAMPKVVKVNLTGKLHRLGHGQGRDFASARAAHGQGRRRQGHGIRRTGRGHLVRARTGRHHQHGGRTRRHHFDFPERCRDQGVFDRHGPARGFRGARGRCRCRLRRSGGHRPVRP